MRKTKLGLMATAVAALSVAVIGTPALAATTGDTLPQGQEDRYVLSLESLGVDSDVADELVSQLDRGILWDSMKGDKPIAERHSQTDRYNITRFEYADGSVSEVGVELPQEKVAAPVLGSGSGIGRVGTSLKSATGIDSCTYGGQGGSIVYAYNCHVYYNGVTWSSSFRADYQRGSVAQAQYRSGTYNTVAYTLTVDNEQINVLDGGSRIRYSLNLHPAGWGNIPFYLDLKVTTGSAYATYGP